MIKRKWPAWGLALAGVVLVLALALAGAEQMFARSDKVPVEDLQVSAELQGSALVCQTFITRYPGLSQIRIRLATFSRDNSGTGVAHLRAAPQDAEDLYTWTIDTSLVQDNAFQAFDLVPPLAGEGQTLSVCLAAPDAEPGNAIGIWGTRQNAYERGTAIPEGMPAAGISDLVFELWYRVPVTRAFPVVANRLAEAKPVWWGQTWFYLGLGGAFVLLLGLLFYACIDGLHRV